MLRNRRRAVLQGARIAFALLALTRQSILMYVQLFARSPPTYLAVVRPDRIPVPPIQPTCPTHAYVARSSRTSRCTSMQKPKPALNGSRHFSWRRMTSPSSVYVARDSTDIGVWSDVSCNWSVVYTILLLDIIGELLADTMVAGPPRLATYRVSVHRCQLAVSNVVATITWGYYTE